MNRVVIFFSDGDTSDFECKSGETVLAAARRSGIKLASDCEAGDCQTCRAGILRGRVDYDPTGSVSLSDEELDQGDTLCCMAIPESDLDLRVPYTRASLLPVKSYAFTISEIRPLAHNTVALRGRLPTRSQFIYYPGQYVNLLVPGSEARRSFSMATNSTSNGVIEFLVRLVPGGIMSAYLQDRAQEGDTLALLGPFGVFYLRSNSRKKIMVAGGTGIAPIAAMLREMVARAMTRVPVVVCFGVNTPDELFYLEELNDLGERFESFELRVTVARPDASWNGRTGYVTDALERSDLDGDQNEAYVCGPPPMIQATKNWLQSNGLCSKHTYAEEFQPAC